MEAIQIPSDHKTVFLRSTAPGTSAGPKPAVIVPGPHHPDWDLADMVHRDLENAHWIASTTSPTPEEAVAGGHYIFERKFELTKPVDSVVSAEFLALVDNWCTPTVNGHEMARKGGKIDLMKWDVAEHLKEGENVISFNVENNAAPDYLSDDPRWQEWNPYGLKYLIRILHKA